VEIFLDLLAKTAPLYALVAFGFVAGRRLGVTRESVSALLIYLISPLVVVNGLASATVGWTLFFLPALFLSVSATVALGFFWLGRRLAASGEEGLLAFAAGAGNTGYFGLPVILSVLGERYLSYAVLAVFGIVLFENTLGYYLIARGSFSSREAFAKMVRLPAIYAFCLGLALALSGVGVPSVAAPFFANIRGAYSVLGMMLVGIGLAGVSRDQVDRPLILWSAIAKFAVWPAASFLVCLADARLFHFLPADAYPVVMILSIVPLASNTVAFASHLGVAPGKAALAVLATTVSAAAYIPVFMATIYPALIEALVR
jgi:predicted permease